MAIAAGAGRTAPTEGRKRRVRVAYCIDTMDIGGTEMNAVRTAERLDRSRFDLVVASLHGKGPLIERYQRAGIRVVHFPITSLYRPSMVQQGLRLVRFLQRERIDILHCHDLYANLFGAPWGRLARVPVVITSRRWVHPVANKALEVANRLVYSVGHRVMGNSAAVTKKLREDDGVAADRILHVPNFVDDNAFQPLSPLAAAALRAEFGIPADALVIGCIARLAPVKDHATLLRALAILKTRCERAHLVLVGDGECRAQLEQLASQLQITGNVHFVGYRPNEPNLHHLFDISVLSSLSEGFPNSLVEAMAAGRPVVATAVGGNVDAVRPDTGALVAAEQPDLFVTQLERLLRDPALRKAMGEAALRVARSEYHANAIISKLEAIYLGLMPRSAW